MHQFSGNVPGTGGLVTFKDSNWLISIVLAHQPHFLNRPAEVQVFWGFALFPDRVGNFLPKAMAECNGAQILQELCGHLRFDLETVETAKRHSLSNALHDQHVHATEAQRSTDVSAFRVKESRLHQPVCRNSRRCRVYGGVLSASGPDGGLRIASNETPSVRRHDLDLVILVSELGGRGHSAIGVDVEIGRLLRHYDLLLSRRFVEIKRDFFCFGELLPQCNPLRSYSEFSKDRSANRKRS
jgi:hypothetical protein